MSRRGGVPGRAHDTIRPDVAELLRVAADAHAKCGEWPWIYARPRSARDSGITIVTSSPQVVTVPDQGAIVWVDLATVNSAQHLGLMTDRIGGWLLTTKGRRLAAATTKETT